MQAGLFPDDSVPDELVGYRGPSACQIAGITYRQLDYWARTSLVVPSIRSAAGSGSQRLYSFKDILVLKIVKRLLDTGISLHNIRVAVDHLRQRGVRDLANITLFSDGTTVYECTSAEEVVDLLQGGQGVFGIAVSGAMRELTGAIADFPGERADGGESIAAPEDELASRRKTPRPQDRLIPTSAAPRPVDSATHRPCAGEFRDRQPRTPKEQHLSVNLSGTQDRAGPRCLWKAVAPRLTRPWGKALREAAESLRRPHGSTTEGEEPQRFCPDPSGVSCTCSIITNRNFADRHIGPDADAVATMLKTIGVGSLDELADKALPAGILDALSADGVAPGLDQLPPAASEDEALAELRAHGRLQHRRGVDDRAGLLRHADATGVAPQHP